MSKTKEEWAKLGVHNEQDFARHINQTIYDKETQVCQAHHNDRDIYYNKQTNTLVAVDPNSLDNGTCYLPEEGEKQFQAVFDKDMGVTKDINEKNPDKKIPEPEVKTGGIEAIYPREKNQDKSHGKTDAELSKEQKRREIFEQLQQQDKREKDKDRAR